MKKIALSFVMGLIAILAMPNMVSAESSQGWTTVVQNMKTSSVVQKYKSNGYIVSITDDSGKMEIDLSIGDLAQSVATITYYYANDIVSFRSTVDASNIDGALFYAEQAFTKELLNIVAAYYGYDVTEFANWLDTEMLKDSNTLDLGNDGIEFTTQSAITTAEGVTVTPNIDYISFKTLKVNVECGIPAFHTDVTTPEPTPDVEESEPTPDVEEPTPTPDVEGTVENPNTGLYVSLGVLAIAIVGAITFVSSKKKNYFSKI